MTPPTTTSLTTTSSAVTTTVSGNSDIPTYYAIKSGNFNDPSIWKGGIAPFGKCFINITANANVTFTEALFTIEVYAFYIHGTFEVTSSGEAGFTFGVVITLIVYSGGTFVDHTESHHLYCFAESLLIFHPGAFFIGFNSLLIKITALPAKDNIDSQYTLGSTLNGPFTFSFLIFGPIRLFLRVTYIVRQTGEFNDTETWLGHLLPTLEDSILVGGCALYIPSNTTLRTGSLKGELKINFTHITIDIYAVLELIAITDPLIFKFFYIVKVEVRGTLHYMGIGSANAAIFIPAGSRINIYASGRFISSNFCYLRIYSIITNQLIGDGYPLGTLIIGPYFIIISIEGIVTVNRPSE
jgi:hypothetical protein